MNRYVPWLLFCAASLLAVYLFVKLVDVGLSVDGARTGEQGARNQSNVAVAFVRAKWLGASREELLEVAKELEAKGEIVKNYEETVEVGEMTFAIRDGKVSEVKYFNE